MEPVGAPGGLSVAAETIPDERAVLERAGGENFTVASVLLGRRTARHLTAIYGFARLVDELGDTVSGDRLAQLDWLETELDRAYAGTATHPLLQRLTPTLRELVLPRGPFVRLIDANRRDQEQTVYATWEELLDYCTLSANPVGELVLHVFGAATAENIALSDSVCTALQVAEHLQDVAEDFRAGRIYLPAEDLHRFDVAADDLGLPSAPAELRELVGFETERTRALLEQGGVLVGRLHGRARFAVAGYVAGGHAALDAIEAAGYDVLAGAPTAGTRDKLARTVRVWRTGR